MTAATCREVQGAIARDDDAPEVIAETARHLRGCADCRAQEQARSRIRQGILRADDQLDDLTRARVLGRLLQDRQEQRRQAHTKRGQAGARMWLGWTLAWTLAFSAVLVFAVLGVLRARRPAAFTPIALLPYAVHGDASSNAPSSGGLDRVELPAHASMRARLGPAADFVLLGPLRLAVRDGDDTRAAVELRQGTLIGDFDGSTGRRLRIVTADATVDIVGTRFLVEASGEHTRVSVEHGRVRVESHGQVRFVGAQQEWTTDQPGVEALDATRASLFQRAAREDLEELVPEAAAAPSTAAAPSGADPSSPAATGPTLAEPARTTKRPSTTHASNRTRNVALRMDGTRSASVPDVLPQATQAAPSRPQQSTSPVPAGAASSAPPLMPALMPSPAIAPPPAATGTAPAVAAHAPVAPAAAPVETASSLYRQAESALGQGDQVAGKRLLDRLIRAFPDQPATDSARYELAVMAEKAGQSGEALAQTREILRPGANGPFVEPAQFLRCRVYLAEDRGAAAACLSRFVRDFPGSPHDEVALRALIELAREGGRCDDASRLAETYLQRHPTGRFGAEANRARSHCGR